MKLATLYDEFESGKIAKADYIEKMHQRHKILFDYLEYMKSTDIESIEINQSDIVFRIKDSGVRLLIDPDDKRFIPIEIFNFKATEAQEKKMIMALVGGCKVVVDVGANIGWYTLNFSLVPGLNKIYAFEPIKHTFNYLKRHLALNQVSKAEVFNIGLSDEVGEREFYWTTEETGSSSMANIRERSSINIDKCELDTLDRFMGERNEVVDFIKIDVEGAELFVIRGATQCIARDKPVIFAELLRKWAAKFDYHPNDVIDMLSALGYDVFVAAGGKLKPIDRVTSETVETNFFFLHREKHAQLIAQHRS